MKCCNIDDNISLSAVRVQFFEPQNYTVTEGDMVNITLAMNTSDYMFDFTVTLQNIDGTATGESFNCNNEAHAVLMSPYIQFHLSFTTAGSDYATGPYTVTFSAGLMYATLMLSTMDDNTTELAEYFRVMIISTDLQSAVEIRSSYVSSITIEDNDPGSSLILTVLLHLSELSPYILNM